MRRDEAHLLALLQQVVDHVLYGLRDGAHGHDDFLRAGRPVVVERMVFPPGQFPHLLHVVFHHVRHGLVELVGRLPHLEVNVGVLRHAPGHRPVRVEGVFPERIQRLPVKQACQLVELEDLDLLDFMGRAEPVEEMQKRNPALDGGKMGHAPQVHDLLDAARGKYGETGLARRVDVGVVAENGKRMSGQGTRAHVEYAGQQFPGYFIHVRDHQEKPLGSGVRRGEGPGLQGPVHGRGRSRLRLHFHHPDHVPEDICKPVGGPFIGVFGHRRRGRDRIYRGHLGEGISDMGRRHVSVHRFHFVFAARCGHVLSPRLPVVSFQYTNPSISNHAVLTKYTVCERRTAVDSDRTFQR